MNKTLNNILAKLSYLKSKRIIAAICIILILFISLFAYLILFSDSKSNQNIIHGIVYINGQPAPFGTNVSIVFSNGIAIDKDGTNETGVFEVDVTGFIDEFFEIKIVNEGNTYIGTDEMGNILNMSLSENNVDWIDVFVITSSSNDDDSSDDDDDGEEENESSYLFIEKSVWNKIDAEWKNNESVEIGGNVQFNITVIYNGSNLSEINVLDIIPDGLEYINNATINGNVTEPIINNNDNSLLWNISAISDENITLYIQYNTTVLRRSTLQNNVTVNLIKNNTSAIIKHSNAMVYVFGDLIVSKTLKNSTETSWSEIKNVDVGEIVRFNISVIYNGSYLVNDLIIQDNLPIGLIYIGNSTLNGQETIPIITDDNKTVIWNISTLSPGEIIFIEFDVNITINATLQNTVFISANESIGKPFNESAIATIVGNLPQNFVCKKTVSVDNSTWKDTINAYVGDMVTFNVTIKNHDVKVYNLAIIDTMPISFQYVNGSSVIFWENKILNKEPDYSETNNTYLWLAINKQNFDPNESGYFMPGDTIILHYDVIINESGTYTNKVEVNSSTCESGCDPLTGSDSATINATIPMAELSVEIIVPNHVYVGEFVEIISSVVGGNLPYFYEWDTDNDSIYNDATKSSFIKKWDTIGTYPISLIVTDNSSENCTDSVNVSVTIEPLTVNAGGPYNASQNELIQFYGFASGGIRNYTWFWDFNDGNVSPIQNSSHAFSQVKTYNIKLSVTDDRNITVNDTTFVNISIPDEEDPEITIESPIDAIYYKNRAMFPFFTPFIFGTVDINVTAEDNDSTVNRIELYINNLLVHSINSSILNYIWDEKIFGKQTISIKAFDSYGNLGFIEKNVLKFF